jgi:hypothetical protein
MNKWILDEQLYSSKICDKLSITFLSLNYVFKGNQFILSYKDLTIKTVGSLHA